MDEQARRSFYVEVGKLIRNHRGRRLSQAALGKHVGLSRVSIVNIENGKQAPPLHVLFEIARVLGVELADLVPVIQSPDGVLAAVPQEFRGFAESIMEGKEAKGNGGDRRAHASAQDSKRGRRRKTPSSG